MQIDKELLDHVSRGETVLFAGDACEEDGVSPNPQLASALVEKSGAFCSFCREAGRCLQPSACLIPLPTAAQLYESKTNRQSLVDFVIQFFAQYNQPNLIHHAIARLPFRVIVTTAYDNRLESALRLAQRRVTNIVYDTDVPFDDPDRVQLIRLHGSISQPDSLLLTEDDVADLFSRLPTVTRILQAHFASKTLLFIGYQLNDAHFLSLYRKATVPIARFQRLAYAVQKSPDALVVDRWHGRIKIVDSEPLVFIKDLPPASTPPPGSRVKPPIKELPAEPYKFLDYFSTGDASIFFGRDIESDLLLSTVLANRASIFYGRSGTGKTSLLLARLLPTLEGMGYKGVYIRMLNDPLDEIRAAIQNLPFTMLTQEDRNLPLRDLLVRAGQHNRIVFVLDQFEEFFLRHGDVVRRNFFSEMTKCLWPVESDSQIDVRCVFSLRDDFLGSLDEGNQYFKQDIFLYRCKLENLTQDKALQVILNPAGLFNLPVEVQLKQQLIKDLQDRGTIEPTNLQIVMYTMYRDAITDKLWDAGTHQGAGLTLERYFALGGTSEIINRYLDDVIKSLPAADQQKSRIILKSMVTADRTKSVVAGREIAHNSLVSRARLRKEELNDLLAYLLKKRIIRKFGEEDLYELAHEVMVEKIWAWVSEEELKLFDVRDMLRRELSNFEKFGHLLEETKFSLLHQFQEELALDEKSLMFLFRSALEIDYEVVYWTKQAAESGLPIRDVLLDMLQHPNYRSRATAVTALGVLQDPALMPKITDALKDLYPQVRIPAISALEQIQPSGEWRIHLEHERYIPEGEFIMGEGDEMHRVSTSGYYLSRYLVTNAEYQRFAEHMGRPFTYEAGKADHPVVNMTWFHARDYAQWCRMRLPTEAEWEKAAGWDAATNQKRLYPWGDEFDPRRCNTEESGLKTTSPVNAHSPDGDSPYGVADMAGNVWEWCSSLLMDYPYRSDDGREDLLSSSFRVQRGGSFHNQKKSAECTSRKPEFDTTIRYGNFGIRLAWSKR